MARVTIEDCVEKVESRFELVAVAAQRAKSIASGSPLTIERDGEKNTVVSLREIAAASVNVDKLREDVIRSFQKPSDIDDKPEQAPAVEDVQSLIEQEMEDMKVLQQRAHEAEADENDLFAEDNLDVKD
ncbi:MAG: DNA-directed RNA polymerase subunit omega [Proteobacteria bacterium]|nr:DNA-directed RNA polymerase subunit omega [Pseudomonadota bacterium]